MKIGITKENAHLSGSIMSAPHPRKSSYLDAWKGSVLGSLNFTRIEREGIVSFSCIPIGINRETPETKTVKKHAERETEIVQIFKSVY